MKKYSIICIMLATVALMCGCKKEKDFVTLSAVIDNPAKVYINDDNLPCWNVDDEIYINDRSYTLQTVDGSYAQIDGVTANDDDIYRAIYPASIVASGSDLSASNSVAVMLDQNQKYKEIDGHQEVRVPMGAYISGGTTLQFHNLCSIVRVTISNPAPNSTKDGEEPGTETNEGDKLIQEIILKSSGTNPVSLSGTGTATITGVGTGANADKIVLSDGNPTVSLLCGGVVVAQGDGSKSFDIFVPEFTNSNITITINTDKGFVEATTTSAVSLNHNSIVTINANVANVTAYPAELLPGPQFNAQAASCAGSLSNIHNVVFEYNSNRSATNYEFQTEASTTRIYGSYANNTLTIFTAADKIYANRNCNEMFKGMGLTTTPDFDGFTANTSTKDGQAHEYGDHFNAKHVALMKYMFTNCTSLTSFNFGVFANTYALQNTAYMFSGCTGLRSVSSTGYDGSSSSTTFTTENVLDMGHMFQNCSHLGMEDNNTVIPINLSIFNTCNVRSMGAMFDGCSNLVELIIASPFTTAEVKSMEAMFRGCSKLEGESGFSNHRVLKLTTFNTGKATIMKNMFQNCSHLIEIEFPNTFKTSNVTSMEGMFDNCSSLKNLDLSMFRGTETVSSLTSTRYMFHGCTQLENITFTTPNNPNPINTASVTDMYGMFLNCSALKGELVGSGDNSYYKLSLPFTTSSVTNMQAMFMGCSSLTHLDISSFNTGNATTIKQMFRDCRNLSGLTLPTSFNTSNVLYMRELFYQCYKLTSINLGNDFSVRTDIRETGEMFKKVGDNSQACTVFCSSTARDYFTNHSSNLSTPNYVVFVVPVKK